MPSTHFIHVVVIALTVAVTVSATGAWSLVAVPSLVLFYVGAIYRRCPFRTEVVFLSLFSAYLMLIYTGLWWIPYQTVSAEAWHVAGWIVAGTLFALPLIAVGTFVVVGISSQQKASAAEIGAVRSRASSGALAVALLLAPAWAFAAALAWLMWQ